MLVEGYVNSGYQISFCCLMYVDFESERSDALTYLFIDRFFVVKVFFVLTLVALSDRALYASSILHTCFPSARAFKVLAGFDPGTLKFKAWP